MHDRDYPDAIGKIEVQDGIGKASGEAASRRRVKNPESPWKSADLPNERRHVPDKTIGQIGINLRIMSDRCRKLRVGGWMKN